MGIVGEYGSLICLWSPIWDLLADTEKGLLNRRDDGIRWRSQNWLLLAGAAILKGKLIET